MFSRSQWFVILAIQTFRIASESHDLIYNDDIVYYDECRISVSPRNYLQPVRAFVQVQKPCNGTLLWTYPNLQLTLTIVNLENETFTICFEKKAIDEKLVRSINIFDSQRNQAHPMRDVNGRGVSLLCGSSDQYRVSVVVDAQPLYAGIYLRYGMFNDRHPWTNGPFPGWERSEKYLYGPSGSVATKPKKQQRNRKVLHHK